MKEKAKKTALITGASLGIGFELARLCARDGHDVVLVARSKDKLEDIATDLRQTFGVGADVIGMDLSLPGAAAALASELHRRGHQIDILVNNAGIGLYGPFLDYSPEQDGRMLQLNMIFLTELTRLIARSMMERGGGRILNVASTAAFQPGPLMSTYYASKSYVLSFSEAVNEELRGTGVTVTALCPGPTASGFQAAAAMEGARMLKLAMQTSAEVADTGYRAMKKGKPVVISGFSNKLLAASVRFTPRCIVTRLSRYFTSAVAA